jgi:hypothetical protein
MPTAAIDTMIKMVESLPEPTQNQVVEHLREYLADLMDEYQWDMSFKMTENQLKKAAKRARQEIALGKANPLVFD